MRGWPSSSREFKLELEESKWGWNSRRCSKESRLNINSYQIKEFREAKTVFNMAIRELALFLFPFDFTVNPHYFLLSEPIAMFSNTLLDVESRIFSDFLKKRQIIVRFLDKPVLWSKQTSGPICRCGTGNGCGWCSRSSLCWRQRKRQKKWSWLRRSWQKQRRRTRRKRRGDRSWKTAKLPWFKRKTT